MNNCGRAIDDFLEWDLAEAPVAPQYGADHNGGLSPLPCIEELLLPTAG